MKTIETKPGVTLGFVLARDINFYTVFPEGANADWKPPKVISKLSEITEEQAKELIPNTIPQFMDAGVIRNWKYDPLNALKEGVKSVGIEEKDFGNYLVVRL
jgi:hypothetical protein